MGRMSRSVRRTFCRCSSAGLVVRVVTMQILIFSFFPFFSFVSLMTVKSFFSTVWQFRSYCKLPFFVPFPIPLDYLIANTGFCR